MILISEKLFVEKYRIFLTLLALKIKYTNVIVCVEFILELFWVYVLLIGHRLHGLLLHHHHELVNHHLLLRRLHHWWLLRLHHWWLL